MSTRRNKSTRAR